MTTITGIQQTEFGVTDKDHFYKKVSNGKCTIIRSTPNVKHFLEMIFEADVKKTIEDKERLMRMPAYKSWWTGQSETFFRGSFNEDLYLKIITAKNNLK